MIRHLAFSTARRHPSLVTFPLGAEHLTPFKQAKSPDAVEWMLVAFPEAGLVTLTYARICKLINLRRIRHVGR